MEKQNKQKRTEQTKNESEWTRKTMQKKSGEKNKLKAV